MVVEREHGRAGTMTRDYKRNGTTDLFAALNITTGEVITQCRERHTGADVLAFFKTIDVEFVVEPRGALVQGTDRTGVSAAGRSPARRA